MPNHESNQSLEALGRRLSRVLADLPPLGAQVQLDFGAGGHLLMDARQRPPAITVGTGPAECTLVMGLDTLKRVLSGELDGAKAFMQGEMTISGDVELAVRLNELLGQGVAGRNGGAQPG